MSRIPRAGRLALAFLVLLVALPVAAQTDRLEDVVSYGAGFEAADQFLAQDSTFDFDRYREGFAAGLRRDMGELAYSLGFRAGLDLSNNPVTDLDADLFLAGVRSRQRGEPPRYPEAQVLAARSVFSDSLQLRQLRDIAQEDPDARWLLEQIRANGAASRAFLADVERRPGVQKTASGLLYTITAPGQGTPPTRRNDVRVRFVARFPDGTEFYRNYDEAGEVQPLSIFEPGVAEVLMLLRPGGQATAWLSPNLAYGLVGTQGPPGNGGEGGVPPNTALEYEVTLVEVLPSSYPTDTPER